MSAKKGASVLRFFIRPEDICQGEALLSPEDGAHLCRVLRRRAGDRISLCDGQGMDYLAEIAEARPEQTRVRILESRPSRTEPSVQATLYAGLSKGERFDFLIQKAAELGAARVTPFTSRYCVVRLEERDKAKKQARMQKIALEACKQSLRSRVMEIGPILTFEQAVEEAAQYPCPLFLYEKENKRSLSAVLRSGGRGPFAAVSGPEGGFSPEEAAFAASRGLHSGSVGPRILRCETAPLAALCAVMYETSNFDIGE